MQKSEAAVRRLGVIGDHVVSLEEEEGVTPEDRKKFITRYHHGVFLPERLTDTDAWHVVRSAVSPEKLISTFPPPDHRIRTLYDILQASVLRFTNEPYLGTRKQLEDGNYGHYTWITYKQAATVRTEIGSGLIQLGLQRGSTVGIFSINCKDWVLLDSACHAYSMITVPLYDTLGPDIATYICNHAEVEAVGCSAASLKTMIDSLPRCPTVKVIVVWGMDEDALPAAPSATSCQIVTLRQLVGLGTQNLKPHIPPRSQDVALICYTSGTTGVPKGAKITHRGIVANTAGNVTLVHNITSGHRHLSYLPLAHIYERLNLTVATYLGTAYGFYHGDVLSLLDDVMELKPTYFSSVMNGVKQSNIIKRQLFSAAYASKKASLGNNDSSQALLGSLYDALVFSALKEKLGGKVEYILTGASPISSEVMDFLRISFGAYVLEGYGMTETSCTITLTNLADTASGHVGSPVPCCEVKLVDIPEMSYLISDKPYPRGEVCVRGPSVFIGYHKDDAQTKEVIDGNGWFHTGDVGCWIEEGRLKIIDRKKNLFKLAQGEYVAPEKIENIYSRCPMVAQAFIYGDSLKHQLVGVIVPDPEVLIPWAKQQGIKKTFPSMCDDINIIAMILDGIQAEGRVAGLAGFEQVQAICLIPKPFSVDNDLLTPTFKLKRHQAKEKFIHNIDALYRSLASKGQTQIE